MCERSKADHKQNRPPRLKTLHGLLQERFPQAFPNNYDDLRPLKIGILADLIERLPGFDPTALRRALANHASRDGYLLALLHSRGDRRYDLTAGRPGIRVACAATAEGHDRAGPGLRAADGAGRARTEQAHAPGGVQEETANRAAAG